jgi:hypothetical protein
VSTLRRPCVVVSQPMYFPWVGFLGQVRLCDAYVDYADVQFSKGSFSNRVQVKTAQGIRWLTVPLHDLHLGQAIDAVAIDERADWRRSQRDALRQAYRTAPFRDEMLALVDEVFAGAHRTLAELSFASTMALVRYFGLDAGRAFHDVASLDTPGASTQRVVDLCARLGAATYLTGHGARRYLEHERFEARGIDVAYIDYTFRPWPQLHGEFTPYVSALDLVAHRGRAGADSILGQPIPWREFLADTAPQE